MTFIVVRIRETNADDNERHSAGSNGSMDGLVALTLGGVVTWTIAGLRVPIIQFLELNLSKRSARWPKERAHGDEKLLGRSEHVRVRVAFIVPV